MQRWSSIHSIEWVTWPCSVISAPAATIMGAVITQEVTKIILHLFKPIDQWFCVDFLEILPSDWERRQFSTVSDICQKPVMSDMSVTGRPGRTFGFRSGEKTRWNEPVHGRCGRARLRIYQMFWYDGSMSEKQWHTTCDRSWRDFGIESAQTISVSRGGYEWEQE